MVPSGLCLGQEHDLDGDMTLFFHGASIARLDRLPLAASPEYHVFVFCGRQRRSAPDGSRHERSKKLEARVRARGRSRAAASGPFAASASAHPGWCGACHSGGRCRARSRSWRDARTRQGRFPRWETSRRVSWLSAAWPRGDRFGGVSARPGLGDRGLAIGSWLAAAARWRFSVGGGRGYVASAGALWALRCGEARRALTS